MVRHTKHSKVSVCSECGKRKYCIADDTLETLATEHNHYVSQNLVYRPGKTIFHQGDPAKHLFFIKSGSAKNVYHSKNGDQQIVNFHFPDDLIDLLSLKHGYHASSASVLENSVICAFSLDFIRSHSDRLTALSKKLSSLSESEVIHHHETLLAISQRVANVRVLNFLLELIDRQNLGHGDSATFRLTMSRSDIANYLGLAPETVSRELSKFVKLGLIRTNKKTIQVNDIKKLLNFQDV